jgi:hypothetical protein
MLTPVVSPPGLARLLITPTATMSSTMAMIGIVFVACLRRGASAFRYTPLSILAADRTCCRRSGGHHQVVAEDDHWPCE